MTNKAICVLRGNDTFPASCPINQQNYIEHYIEDNVLYVKLWTRQIRGHYEPETFSAPLDRNTSIIPYLEKFRDFKQE